MLTAKFHVKLKCFRVSSPVMNTQMQVLRVHYDAVGCAGSLWPRPQTEDTAESRGSSLPPAVPQPARSSLQPTTNED